jgi:hypothetical protein
VLILGSSRFAVGLGEALQKAGIPVLVSDPNRTHLRMAREAGLPTFFGDILSEGAEARIELMSYRTLLAATDNDAYNTLVTTEIAAEFGRENIFQIRREKADYSRYQLPATLGGRSFGDGSTYAQMNRRMWQGWEFVTTDLTEKFSLDDWRAKHPGGIALAQVGPNGHFAFLEDSDKLKVPEGAVLIGVAPERPARARPEAPAKERAAKVRATDDRAEKGGAAD